MKKFAIVLHVIEAVLCFPSIIALWFVYYFNLDATKRGDFIIGRPWTVSLIVWFLIVLLWLI